MRARARAAPADGARGVRARAARFSGYMLSPGDTGGGDEDGGRGKRELDDGSFARGRRGARLAVPQGKNLARRRRRACARLGGRRARPRRGDCEGDRGERFLRLVGRLPYARLRPELGRLPRNFAQATEIHDDAGLLDILGAGLRRVLRVPRDAHLRHGLLRHSRLHRGHVAFHNLPRRALLRPSLSFLVQGPRRNPRREAHRLPVPPASRRHGHIIPAARRTLHNLARPRRGDDNGGDLAREPAVGMTHALNVIIL